MTFINPSVGRYLEQYLKQNGVKKPKPALLPSTDIGFERRGIDIPVGESSDIGFTQRPVPEEEKPDEGFVPRGDDWKLTPFGQDYLKVFPDVFDRHTPGSLYVLDEIGKRVSLNQEREQDLRDALSGITPQQKSYEERRKYLEELQAQTKQLAAQTNDLDDSQFDTYVKRLEELSTPNELPKRPKLEQPSDLMMGLAAALSLASPEHSFDILGTVGAHGLKKQQSQFEDELARWELKESARKDKQKLTGDLIELETRRSLANQAERSKQLERLHEAVQGELNRLTQLEIADDKNLTAIEKLMLQLQADEREKVLVEAFKNYYGGEGKQVRDSGYSVLKAIGIADKLALPPPPEVTNKDLKTQAYVEGQEARTKQILELIDTRKSLMLSQVKLNEKRATKLAKETSFMDEKHQLDMAKGYKAIENMNSLINDRNVKNSLAYARLAQEGWAKSQTTINKAMETASAQANTIRQSLKALETQYNNTIWTDADKDKKAQMEGRMKEMRTAISNLQGHWKTMNDEAKAIRSTLTEQKVLAPVGGRVQVSQPQARGDWRTLKSFAEKQGFVVTSTTGGKHNEGSLHPKGLAIDIRTQGKTEEEIQALIEAAVKQGFGVRDERTHPPGQKIWGGPHLHLSILPKQKPKNNRSSNNRNSNTTRRNSSSKPKLPSGWSFG